MKPKPDLTTSKLSTTMNEIQMYTEQLKREIKYQNSTNNNELIQQNRRILDILKKIEMRIDKQLQVQKKTMLATNPHHRSSFSKDQLRILQQQQAANAKLLTVLQKDLQTTLARRKLYEQGLEQRVRDKKSLLQGKIIQMKLEIRKLSLEEKSQEKKLAAYENLLQADYLKAYARMEEELRVYTLKHAKALARHTKLTHQLQISTTNPLPQFHIPQQIKASNKLDQKQQHQYRQYQSIVRLCGVLTKRNDSEKTKANRIYTQKLKELQRVILMLAEVDQAISAREREVQEGRKNVDVIKVRLESQQRVDRYGVGNKTTFNEGERKKSYSSVKLQGLTTISQPQRLRSRGMSFGKLPAKLQT